MAAGQSCCCPCRPANSAFAGGQLCPGQHIGGRSILVTLLPWARNGNGGGQSGNSAFAGGRSLPRASKARAARRPAAVNGQLCPGQGNGLAAVNPAAHCGRPTLPIAAAGRSLPRAAYWRRSLPRAAYRRRSLPRARQGNGGRSILLLPLPAGQSGNSALGKEWNRQQDRTAGRRRSIR